MTPLRCRRRFLGQGFALAAGVLPMAARATTPLAGERRFAAVHTHTGERIDIVYAADTGPVPGASAQLDRFLRDHYSGTVGRMDPQLFELLRRVQQALGTQQPYEIVSGYRCPATNRTLRETRGGGVATKSLHMEGRAIDVRLSGVPLAELRDAALELQAGGVGYYPDSRFVHVDTGRVRRW